MQVIMCTPKAPMLTVGRAAEVSTGVICVCAPPLAILAHRHAPQRPTRSIMNGDSNSRSANLSGRRRPTSTDEEILFDRGDLELQHRDVKMASGTVVTGVVGGATSHGEQAGGFEVHESRVADRDGIIKGEDHITGIMRTVRMEQSYM